MEINESHEKELQLIEEDIDAAQKSIRFARQTFDTFNMDQEDDENEEVIDPTRFMTRQEATAWGRLSKSERQQFLKEGAQKAELSIKRKTKSEAVSEVFQEYIENQQMPYSAQSFSDTSRQKTQRKISSPIEKKPDTHSDVFRKEGRPELRNTGRQESNQTGRISVHSGKGAVQMENTAVQIGKVTAQTGEVTVQAGKAAATGGISFAIEKGKKTASAFRESLESYAISSSQSMYRAQQKFQDIKENNRDVGTLPSMIKYVGATVAAAATVVLAIMAQIALTFFTALLTVLVFILVTVMTIVVLISVLTTIIVIIVTSVTNSHTGSAEQIVEVALDEEGTTNGSKYWEFTMESPFVDGSETPWCACFVSWCANECGYLDEGIFPKSGSVATYRRFFREKNLLHEEQSYIPKTGDLILFGSDDHIGIVQYIEDGRVITIEGNTSDAVHTRSYTIGNSYITGYCTPEYPAGEESLIPDGMGIYHTYMGWRTITSPTSLQYQLREESGEHYDEEGFAKIDNRYVIACTSTFGNVGDYVDFYREDGTVIHAVIGDIKNPDDPGCNQYGHADGQCVVEYIVQQSMWYPSHANPGTSGCHPEWNSRVEKAIKIGRNYFS